MAVEQLYCLFRMHGSFVDRDLLLDKLSHALLHFLKKCTVQFYTAFYSTVKAFSDREMDPDPFYPVVTCGIVHRLDKKEAHTPPVRLVPDRIRGRDKLEFTVLIHCLSQFLEMELIHKNKNDPVRISVLKLRCDGLICCSRRIFPHLSVYCNSAFTFCHSLPPVCC